MFFSSFDGVLIPVINPTTPIYQGIIGNKHSFTHFSVFEENGNSAGAQNFPILWRGHVKAMSILPKTLYFRDGPFETPTNKGF